MKNLLKLFLLTTAMVFVFNTGDVNAQYYSQSNVKKSISIDKKVRNVHDNNYLDNIDFNKKVFYENDLIEFKISVLNNGIEDLTNLSVGDSLPLGLSLIFYPGTLDKTTNSLVWTIDSLKAGESRDYLIRAKIANVNNLMKDGSATAMLINKSDIKTGDIYDKDSASYYVGIPVAPKTGDNSLIIKTITVFLTAGGAVYLRKLARGY